MKEKVLEYLKTDRSFKAGVALYNSLPNANLAIKNFLNREGESPKSVKELHYELSKAVAIPPAVFEAIIHQPIQAPEHIEAVEHQEPTGQEGEPDQDPVQSVTYLFESHHRMTLREEYPFLEDPNCPDELKILAADLLTSHKLYIKSHEELFTAETEEQQKQAAEATLLNFELNRAILDEFDHYKAHGTFLGKHPIFAVYSLIKEIRNMSAPELIKLQNSTKTNISRNRKTVDDPKASAEKKEGAAKRLAEYELVMERVQKAIEALGSEK